MWLVLSLFFFSLVIMALVWFLLPKVLAWLRGQKQQFEQSTEQYFESSFLFLRGQTIVKATAGLFVVLFLLFGLFGFSLFSAVLVCAVCFLCWPVYLSHLKKKRLARFELQFPDYLLALAGALRAGSSLAVALQRITPLAHAPLVQELGLLLKEQRMGLSLDEALARLSVRMPCESTSLFKSAIAVAGQSGGELADLFHIMARTISQRLYIEGRIRALTAQGRMQAWLMALLPVLVATALYFIDYDLIAPLWQESSGQLVLLLMLLLEMLGLWLIYRIVNISF